jgi:outer membrane protein TolC
MSDELSDLLDGDFNVWSLVGGIVQPLFQGGRIKSGIDLARARNEEAVALYVQDVLNAYGEVAGALSAEAFLSEREKDLAVAAEQSLAARHLAEDRYGRGLADVLTMLSAQRAADLSESQLLSVRRQRLDARIDLHLSLGGGFDASHSEGVPEWRRPSGTSAPSH